MSEKKSLMVLVEERRAIADQLETAENPIELLEQIDQQIQVKAAGIALYIERCQMMVDSLKETISRLQSRKKAFEQRIENLKGYALVTMKNGGITRIESPECSIYIQKNQPKVVVQDKRLIPLEFCVLKDPEVDKEKIKQHWRDTGEIIQGVNIVQDESLRIR